MTTPAAGNRDPLEAQIARAHDEVVREKWAPSRYGIIPHIRIGKRWFNVLWLLPLACVGLVLGISIAHELILLPVVQEFIARYPGQPSGTVAYKGFPLWVRLAHVFNLFLMVFIVRSGIQILADHPRLYWNKHCTPGTEWFRFQHEIPKGLVWTAKDDAVTIPGWLGLPGIRHSIGLARWWHFSCDLLWLINGIVFYVLLFTTHQWERLVPTTWDVFPNAASTALQYLALRLPPDDGWIRYNSLQQIAYFITVFLAAPAAVFTGLMQAPAIANKFGFLGKLVNRQVARSIHFFILLWFVQFFFIHVTMVFITGMRRNLNHITLNNDTGSWDGAIIAFVVLTLLGALWMWATPFTLKHARLVQQIGKTMVGWIKALMEHWDPKTQYSDKDISPFLWPNGLVPESAEYEELADGGFEDYKLRIDGLCEHPQQFSLAQLKSMPKQEQTTAHYCIQGWSGVAKWAGVPMRHILEIVKPTETAKYAVFYSFGEGGEGGIYYDAHIIENMKHELTILAYEMNGKPLPTLYGAPLRLRCENELGFKQVKWISAIEFVDDFSRIGSGQGGYNEDHEFYGYRMPI